MLIELTLVPEKGKKPCPGDFVIRSEEICYIIDDPDNNQVCIGLYYKNEVFPVLRKNGETWQRLLAAMGDPLESED